MSLSVICFSGINVFLYIYFGNTNVPSDINRKKERVPNLLDPDKVRQNVGPDLGPTFCKGYQQTTNVAS